jgi:PAS domain S-box-containing protein
MHVRELNGARPRRLLRQCEQLLWATLESAPVGIALLGTGGSWQLINHSLCRMLGSERAERVAKRFESLFDVDLSHPANFSSAETGASVERRYVRADGQVLWLRLHITSVRDANDQPTSFVVIVEDISASQASERALGIAAHELRLPLSHIKGFISTLRRTDVEWDKHTRREFLAAADHETDRLAHLIDDLLDQASGEPRAAPRRVAVQPKELVLTTVERVRPMIGDREVRTDLPGAMPPLHVAAPAIERVLANLLLNANKYAPPKTPIDVSAEVIGEMLELRVEDRGPGVPREESERIFEPFYRRQVEPGLSEVGHGLGLAICRSIVTAHAGRIWVAPRPGGGARFTVALPVVPRAARQPARPQGDSSRNGRRISRQPWAEASGSRARGGPVRRCVLPPRRA